ncbi:hypothetical protein BN3456_01338 [Clostridium sp. C105KSO13]|nr:hypothetical protein BN3456_01338 [Clostridium sp. C105KSO13]
MELVNNESLFKEIETGLDSIQKDRTSDIILSPFTKDFSLRFCWSSNAIEGNTLSLDETISLIEYDEVRVMFILEVLRRWCITHQSRSGYWSSCSDSLKSGRIRVKETVWLKSCSSLQNSILSLSRYIHFRMETAEWDGCL